jgi:hypothetical protein
VDSIAQVADIDAQLRAAMTSDEHAVLNQPASAHFVVEEKTNWCRDTPSGGHRLVHDEGRAIEESWII